MYFYLHRLCLGQWSDHGERTGGFYACNRYEAAKQEGVVRDTDTFNFPDSDFSILLAHYSPDLYFNSDVRL